MLLMTPRTGFVYLECGFGAILYELPTPDMGENHHGWWWGIILYLPIVSWADSIRSPVLFILTSNKVCYYRFCYLYYVYIKIISQNFWTEFIKIKVWNSPLLDQILIEVCFTFSKRKCKNKWIIVFVHQTCWIQRTNTLQLNSCSC